MRQPHAVTVVIPANRLSRVVREIHEEAGISSGRMLVDYVFLPLLGGFGQFSGATLLEVEGAQTLVENGTQLLGVPLSRVGGYFGWFPVPDVRVELEPFGRNMSATMSWLPPDQVQDVPGWDEVRCMRILEVLFRHGRMTGGTNITPAVMQLRASTESEPISDELRY